jgi:hypothetical protein
MASYNFCVTRRSDAGTETFHARVSFGDIDPGKEVARVYASQKFKKVGTTEVAVSDYDPSKCPGPAFQEVKLGTLSPDIIKDIGEKVAAGDIVGSATAITAATVNVPIATVGAVLGGLKKIIKKWFG